MRSIWLQLEEIYLDECIFNGLTNVNDGFDVSTIAYFMEDDFAKVLERVKQNGLEIIGIEVFKKGKFYDVVTPRPDYDPEDKTWYMHAFAQFKKRSRKLQYSADYHVPDQLLAENMPGLVMPPRNTNNPFSDWTESDCMEFIKEVNERFADEMPDVRNHLFLQNN